MVNNEKTISKLHEVFKAGYRPSRLKQSYRTWIKIGDHDEIHPIEVLNCLAHAFFNPTNEVLRDYKFTKSDDVFSFCNPTIGPDKTFSEILHFVKDVGLKAEECGRNKTVNQFESWKVDAYFKCYPFADYHFMLQESKGIYSHKGGYVGDVQILCETPNEYFGYDYFATYLITNVHANENNPYNKPLLEHSVNHILY